MPASMATKLGIQFARFAQYTAASAASNNAGTHGLRGAFTNASGGTPWAQGLHSGGSANGTGIGGAKFQAGKGTHSSFQNSGRGLANANSSSANDGTASVNDDEDEVKVHSTHGAARVHRPMLQQGRDSIFQSGLRNRLTNTSTSLQLILPGHHGVYVNRSRTISTSRSTERSATGSSHSISDREAIEDSDQVATRHRSLSTSTSNANQADTTSVTERRHEATALPPSAGVSIGRIGRSAEKDEALAEDEGVEEEERKENDGRMVGFKEGLTRASRTNGVDAVVSFYEEQRKSKTIKLTTTHHNLILTALYQLRNAGGDGLGAAVDVYEQMVDDDCAPNNRTYEQMIYVLCARDQAQLTDGKPFPEEGTELDPEEQSKSGKDEEQVASNRSGDFMRAMSMMDAAHSSSYGFGSSKPYNRLIFSALINNCDTKSACEVLEALSANRHTGPSFHTFLFLIRLFHNDRVRLPEETDKAFEARKLGACEKVFEEFETFRNANGWKESENDGQVWNAMIGARIGLGDGAGGVALLEKMLDSNKTGEGERPAPLPSQQTSNTIIYRLLQAGDLVGATSWFEKILLFHDKATEGEKGLMPMPKAVTLGTLFSTLFKKLSNERDSVESSISSTKELFPAIEAANRSLEVIYKNADDETMVTDVGWRVLHSMLLTNAVTAEHLIRADESTMANKISDHSLSHVEKHFKLNIESLHQLHIRPDSMPGYDVWPLGMNAGAILKLVRVLIQQERWHDAASCFTYACFAAPKVDWKQAGSDTRRLMSMSFYRLEQTARMLLGGRYQNNDYSDVYLEMRTDARTHLFFALEYILPAYKQLRRFPTSIRRLVRLLYTEVTKTTGIESLDLSPRAINLLIHTHFTKHMSRPSASDGAVDEEGEMSANESYKEAPFEDVKGIVQLFSDLAKLPEPIRETLDLKKSMTELPIAVGRSEALALLLAIRPSLKLDEPKKRPGRSAATSLDGQSGSDSASAPVTSPASSEQIDQGALLAGYTTSLSLDLPPIQMIDTDYGARLRQKHRQLQQNSSRTPVDWDSLTSAWYKEVKTAIEESGTYPSPEAIDVLLNMFGRGKKLDKVKELYVIGSKVVSELGGDPTWQMKAWFDLEDVMTSSLAHGGDSKLASDHRLRLLHAGCTPRANTYAALIATIRDTTDDALNAEELFEESQRLGVRPTKFLYNAYLSQLSRARKVEKAMQIFGEMRNRGMTMTSITYGTILNACTRTGDEANAEYFFGLMESDLNFRPEAPPFNTMIQFYTQTKPNREKAKHYYEKFRKLRVKPTAHTYKLLLDLYGTMEPVNMDAMETVFGELIADKAVEVRGNHWASLIVAHGIHCKDLERATQVYLDIPQHVTSTRRKEQKGGEPDAVVFQALMSVFLEHQRMDLIDRYLQDRKTKDGEVTAYVLNVLMKAYSRLIPEDGLYRARNLFEEMCDAPMGMAATGNHPIQRQHVSGSNEEEQRLPRGVDLGGYQAVAREPSTYETMVQIEIDHGNVDEALALVERMQYRGYPPTIVARTKEAIKPHHTI